MTYDRLVKAVFVLAIVCGIVAISCILFSMPDKVTTIFRIGFCVFGAAEVFLLMNAS